MKAHPNGPFAPSLPDQSLNELLRQALAGFLPSSPDLSALLDRMEMPR